MGTGVPHTRGSKATPPGAARPTNRPSNTDELLTIHNDLQQQMKVLTAVQSILNRQVALLSQLVTNSQMVEPNYRRPLSQYRLFDWDSIGATILEADDYGPKIVEWGGHQWLRRNADDRKFGTAVWYSRHAGGSGDNATYYTLIKFVQKYGAEPMDEKIAETIGPTPEPAQATAVSDGTGKDWYQDAITCTDELPFDTAVQRHKAEYYESADQVTRARKHICGEWDPEQAKAAADALVLYADEMLKVRRAGGPLSQGDSRAAVASAQRKYKEVIG